MVKSDSVRIDQELMDLLKDIRKARLSNEIDDNPFKLSPRRISKAVARAIRNNERMFNQLTTIPFEDDRCMGRGIRFDTGRKR